MTAPVVKVEAALSNDPLTWAPSWTNLTSYLLNDPAVTIGRGRPKPFMQFDDGTIGFRLYNGDGRFDPTNASGPYFGSLNAGCGFRVSETVNGGDVIVFRGFIDGWRQGFDEAGMFAYVDVFCYDLLGYLGQTPVDLDIIVDFLTDTVGATIQAELRTGDRSTWDDTLGPWERYSVSPAFGTTSVPSVLAGLHEGRSDVMRGEYVAPSPGLVTVSAISDWGMSFWFRNSGDYGTYYRATSAADVLSSIEQDVSGGLNLVYDSGPPAMTSIATDVNGGDWHHLCLINDTTEALCRVYLDGTLETTLPNIGISLEYFGNPYTTAEMQDVFVWTLAALTADEVADLYNLYLGNGVVSTSDYIDAYLDAADIPNDFRDITTTPYGTCAFVEVGPTDCLSQCAAAADTEQGRLFVSRDGKITLHDRFHDITSTRGSTVQATFSDSGTDINMTVAGYTDGTDSIINDVTVTFGTNRTERDSDSASIVTYGGHPATIATLIPSTHRDAARQLAAGIVGTQKDPRTTATPIDATGLQSAANWEALLELEIGDRIELAFTPRNVGSPVAYEAIVEGLRIVGTTSATFVSVDAAPALDEDFFIWDVSTWDGGDVWGY